MHLDAHARDALQRAVGQQALVEQRGRSLQNVGLEALGDADRIVGGVGGDADLGEQALVLQARASAST
jgi:hypothetical protein